MKQSQTIYINFTGGIISPGYLREILSIASLAHVKYVSIGLRQQLIMDVPARRYEIFEEACLNRKIKFQKEKESVPNVMSSYPAAGIFTTESWLREGVYKDVFNLFDHIPRLKINICDGTQNLVPFFTGHINWISSHAAHFWYLRIRFPKTQIHFTWPDLVYTNDVPALSKVLEEAICTMDTTKGQELYKQIKSATSHLSKPADKEVMLPEFSLPYYEGFNRQENTYWLGIYRRDEAFPVDFLIDVCNLCADTKIGQLYTTPWKSIIIKGVERDHRKMWDYVLGKYRINVRHAANELNWQVEENNEDGLTLKRLIIRNFDREDVRTYGLCFAVQTRPHTSMFGSIIIRKQNIKNPHGLKSLDRFEILHTRDFNPNGSDVVIYRQNLRKGDLSAYLISLCKLFYEQQSSIKPPVTPQQVTPRSPDMAEPSPVYQCDRCMTIYDERFGDEGQNIPAGTSFIELSSNYQCSLCESDKSHLKKVQNPLSKQSRILCN